MSKIAFIFPGQGAQYTGMGRDFYEQTETGRKVFDQASELLGFSMPELVFEPNDRLDITEYTQAAMVTTSIAMMKVFTERTGIRPDVAAGLSLGEYCALAAAGVMSDADAITTVRQRGILMQQAVPVGIGSMAAICGQEVGSKAQCIEKVKQSYEASHCLMIGDAPGDGQAAKKNGILFYPICPLKETESWKQFYVQTLDWFLNGQYAGEHERQVIDQFEKILPKTPTWRTQI